MIERFYYVSDVHNEHRKHANDDVGRVFDVSDVDGGKDDSIIYSGDIDQIKSGSRNVSPTLVKLLKDSAKKYKNVYYVFGNHEFYNIALNKAEEKAKIIKELVNEDNVFILNKDTVIYSNLAIIGATLWTNLDNNSQSLKFDLEDKYNGFSDFKKIKYKVGNNYRRLKTNDVFATHLKEKAYIFNQIKKYKKLGYKVLVISHHPPTERVYEFEKDKAIFCNDYEDLLVKYKPDVWVHGHIHDRISYIVNGYTRVYGNALGYNDLEEKVLDFSHSAYFEINLDNDETYSPEAILSEKEIEGVLNYLEENFDD